MKAVILAGGLGTRLSEETTIRPKPMVEIGGMPVLWHIMKTFSAYGIDDFVICCGYKGYVIKEYFANYFLHVSDVRFDVAANRMEVLRGGGEPWRVTLVDTGDDTMTGGRLKRIAEYVQDEEMFCMTYGDGLSDVDMTALVDFHRAHGCMATVTAVKPPGRFGALELDGERVTGFTEKPPGDDGLINGGFFVLQPECLELIADDSTRWEAEPLGELAARDELRAFHHHGFWQPMDTVRERDLLNELWESGSAPWRVW
jgi:glucose-1-phosphate cytidylyltransferase|tara:strand:- start:519 stop:1289 length:771 start_codon:yes stop_codon:yes gene_type:complete